MANQTAAIPVEKTLTVTSSRAYNAAVALFGLLTAVGVAFGIHAFFAGHEAVYGVTREVPWGLLIATYVFFVVTSTGLCLVSSIGHVFGNETFMPIAKRSVFLAIATIISGFMVIGFEIENPWRMAIYNVISPNLTSNIWWMGTLYGAYLFFMLVEFALLQIGRHKEAGMMGLMGVISGVAAHSNLGAVFGLLGAREFWHGPYMPIYFITSAMMSGCAAILFFTWIAYRANGWQMSDEMKKALSATGKLGALLMAVIMFFTTWKVLSGIAGHPPGKYEAMMAILKGPYAANFWAGEVLLGMVAPFLLILAVRARNMKALFWAGAMGMVGIFFMRYDLVVVGQIVPHFHEYGIVGLPEYFSYMPSLHEVMITLGGLSLCALAFLTGEKLFRGHVSEAH
ncbi:polysulfide reductase NrfD [Dissulfurirhabdus thermomarina]|uniref:Polysulfide reductase NrfD n=1 Tax=Dissulfurirhabdus thermomarina TaxID=1765737 RepID=A0A6N9TU59_DISTH|nr:NrfD/PsrC family molybdoenzyme membrane anchor subunit [Dissulfurirhabdus thermomarina]NDY42036.1 polysulfide reductase NrfD [Dissulfurirhabdus thermomarina]NMX24547.1 polysulfide reductase NrfD [Dissulfurirhabdus thermomarina]